jgi:hypothetical protein
MVRRPRDDDANAQYRGSQLYQQQSERHLEHPPMEEGMANYITASGLYYDHKTALQVVVTQGIAGSTLVAGKQCLFRFWMHPEDYANVDSILATVDDAKVPIATLFPSSLLIRDDTGPSIGVILRGFHFPTSGAYQVFLSVRDANGKVIQEPIFPPMQFAPTKDLRLLVIPLQGSAPARHFLPTSAWYQDIDLTMQRLGAMLPVRDCVGSLVTAQVRPRHAGLRYAVGKPREAWPLEVMPSPPPDSYWWDQLDKINSGVGNVDHVDILINYRPVQPNLNEWPGGSATHRQNGFPYANCVAGLWNGIEMTAGCFGQEIGHLFALESPSCPTFQDPNDPGHSKSPQVVDPLAFDPLNPTTPRPSFIGDVMNNSGGGAWRGRDAIAYNACNWEVLREGLMNLSDQATGTEINPARTDPCIAAKRIDVTHPEYNHLIGSFADGPLWAITPHGLVPVGPGDPIMRTGRVTAFTVVLHELFVRGITVLNTPTTGDIVAQVTGDTMIQHLTGERVSGGPKTSAVETDE